MRQTNQVEDRIFCSHPDHDARMKFRDNFLTKTPETPETPETESVEEPANA